MEVKWHVTRTRTSLICIWHMGPLSAVRELRSGLTPNVNLRYKLPATPAMHAYTRGCPTGHLSSKTHRNMSKQYEHQPTRRLWWGWYRTFRWLYVGCHQSSRDIPHQRLADSAWQLHAPVSHPPRALTGRRLFCWPIGLCMLDFQMLTRDFHFPVTILHPDEVTFMGGGDLQLSNTHVWLNVNPHAIRTCVTQRWFSFL